MACTCGLAASLVEMVAALTIARPDHAERHQRMEEIRAQAHALADRALELGELELHAYEPVLEALQLRSEDPDRPARLAAALSDAAHPPFELARTAAEISELALDAGRLGTPHLRGDASTGALLAEGACQAAARLVRINLARHPGDARLTELTEITARAAAIRAAAI